MEDTDTNTNTEVVAEQTAVVEQTQPEPNLSETNESSTLSSGEEDNAQVVTNQVEDTGYEARKEARQSSWNQESQRATQVEAQMRSLSPSEQLAQMGMTVPELKVNIIEQNYLWDKVAAKHPELNNESKDFDPDLDKLVYANYVAQKAAGQNVTPLEVADQITGYLEKRSSKVKEVTYKKAEDDIAAKSIVSSKTPKRSGNGGEVTINELKNRARSGDRDAIDELIRHI